MAPNSATPTTSMNTVIQRPSSVVAITSVGPFVSVMSPHQIASAGPVMSGFVGSSARRNAHDETNIVPNQAMTRDPSP